MSSRAGGTTGSTVVSVDATMKMIRGDLGVDATEVVEPGALLNLAPRLPLRVDVAGGGPVGLAFACSVQALLGRDVVVRVFDRRWKRAGDRVVWRDAADGNRRREQVVTLQSNVWSALPPRVQRALFVEGRYGEMWPLGPDSPAERGRPRNIKIRWIEDCLLDLAQDHYGVDVVPEAYTPPATPVEGGVLAICDGARSATRAALAAGFGTPNPDLYSLDGTPLQERVLGIRINARVPDEHTVPLTVAQNRFLFNSLGGGFINMRLTAEEATEVQSIGRFGPVDCIGKQGCTVRPDGYRFVCDRHQATFKPSVDRLSFLWPRIQDGLRLFGAEWGDVVGITSFTLGMTQNSRFTAQLSAGSYAFLLGDAANSLHFWPGRGLNTGLKSALSLVGTLKSRWRGKPLRLADFAAHEGYMQQLQFREKMRAWTTMVMPDEQGRPHGIEDRIRAGFEGPHDRQALIGELFARVRAVKSRLVDRMGSLAADEWYLDRLHSLSDATLKSLLNSAPWITREVGGDEVPVQPLDYPAERGARVLALA
ncbi:FAD-dependent monooxygenase family protein [Actinokineospora bangkokensis]|uniref:FHA domain-containing protein n=1 Tax=Actinokineospora bangkokensis TaxID=1193682 RepID=A0A1Q9LRC9_9PSEU|nr:hypothetical protein [Actinokineospora bangkokensis]OLR94554.1 hypothetical protein BJP25_12505 [Actinokineospora bangkokensis]